MKCNTFLSPIQGHFRRLLKNRWDEVLEDPRVEGRSRWSFHHLLKVTLSGVLAGCKTLREIENFSEILGRRVPDTTLYDLLVQIDPKPLRNYLARGVKEALRSHELPQDDFPIRLTAIDGKNISTTKKELEEGWSWRTKRNKKYHYAHMVLRAFHVSNKLKLHLGQKKVRSRAAEMISLPHLIDELIEDYGRTNLLEVFSMDAGIATIKNAQHIVDRGFHYIMALKDPRKNSMVRRTMKLLDSQKICFEYTERRNGASVTYRLFREKAPIHESWKHATEVWKIEKKTEGGTENRYYVTSLPLTKLSHSQVLQAVRMHWGIENNANWTMDAIWKEDSSPLANDALELVSYLRMLAFNVTSRLKFRKLRKQDAKRKSWRDVLELIKAFFITLNRNKQESHLVFV